MRALVYMCISSCGGLGDRLKGIVHSYLASKETNRTFFIHAPSTFDNRIRSAGLVFWNATIPSLCRIAMQHPINDIDRRKNGRLDREAAGPASCIAVRVNQDWHTYAEQKKALSELFAPFERPSQAYAAIHLRTGGNGDFSGIDPDRDTIKDGLAMLSKLDSTWDTVHIISDSLAAKVRLATECRKTHANCVYQTSKSRHIDRQTTSADQLLQVWDDFRDIAGASVVVRSISGFSKMASFWPKYRGNR